MYALIGYKTALQSSIMDFNDLEYQEMIQAYILYHEFLAACTIISPLSESLVRNLTEQDSYSEVETLFEKVAIFYFNLISFNHYLPLVFLKILLVHCDTEFYNNIWRRMERCSFSSGCQYAIRYSRSKTCHY